MGITNTFGKNRWKKQKAAKLAFMILAHSIQNAYKLVNTRRALEKLLPPLIIMVRSGAPLVTIIISHR